MYVLSECGGTAPQRTRALSGRSGTGGRCEAEGRFRLPAGCPVAAGRPSGGDGVAAAAYRAALVARGAGAGLQPWAYDSAGHQHLSGGHRAQVAARRRGSTQRGAGRCECNNPGRTARAVVQPMGRVVEPRPCSVGGGSKL